MIKIKIGVKIVIIDDVISAKILGVFILIGGNQRFFQFKIPE